MSLKNAYLRAAVETPEQFEACLGQVGLIYTDSAGFDPSEYVRLVRQAHETEYCGSIYRSKDTVPGKTIKSAGPCSAVRDAVRQDNEGASNLGQSHASGTLCALRLPYIWRDKAEEYFDRHLEELREAGFDAWLFRNIESLLYFHEHGLLNDTPFITDHSIYMFNSESAAELTDMIPEDVRQQLSSVTLPLELNGGELEELNSRLCGPGSELVVYGRTPMMVSAQCINKTCSGCDHTEKTVMLTDRKNARMPVNNYCRFCYNIIYNAVPTVLYDLTDKIGRIAPSSVRYEFTTENETEVRSILSGNVPANGGFTRGHLKRGV